ncbi:MAG: sn-glycerol-3-phosphate ABC transporter ATP-binding protein UgpC [Pseudomonadota bacterium]
MTHNGNAPFLEIDGVSKRYGRVDALQDIRIDVEEGGFLVLVGPSGCGKSTLLNMIAGFESVTAGDIRIGGRSVLDLHPSKRDIAMVFQSYALYPNMNVAANIGFGMETRGVPKPEREKRIAEVASILQIEQLLKRKPAQLSGGQRQRVAMGRALVRDPQAFLFDEPLSNLDARLRVDMRTEIKKLHARLGTTIVYVTHDQIEAMTLATRIAVLRDGRVQQIGTPDDIYNRPANAFVADFMGSPAMNKVRATLSLEDDVVQIAMAGGVVPYPAASEAIRARAAQGAPVDFGIRAEDIGTGVEGAPALLHLNVELTEPTGSDTFIVTRDGDASFTARVGNDVRIEPGIRTPFALDMRRAHFFDPETGDRIV